MRQAFKKISGVLICVLIVLPVFATADEVVKETAPMSDPVAQEKNSNPSVPEVKNEMRAAMNDMISITGDVMSGMAAGMQDGSEKVQAQLDGADGTRLISNKKDLAECVQVRVFKSEDQSNGSWQVTLAIKNSNDFPVRLVNLTRKGSVLLLDSDGFAYNPVLQKESERIVTVAARTAAKVTFHFSGLDAKPGAIRLFDTDFTIQ